MCLRANHALYCLFTLCFQVLNSRIPGTTLKKGKGNVLKGVSTRETDPVAWPSDNRLGLYSDCIWVLRTRLLGTVAQMVDSIAIHSSLLISSQLTVSLITATVSPQRLGSLFPWTALVLVLVLVLGNKSWLFPWLFYAVKEKLESKPRQPTIDLSQMAVPIQMTQEKRHSPESPSIAVVESELVAEYITTGRCPLKK